MTPVTWIERVVEADGFAITYWEAGAGERPPLVVLHGAGGPERFAAYDDLAAGTRVLFFELPGFGASPANERTQSFLELAETMAAAIAAAGVERYALLGSSFGGATAVWLTSRHPERVDALVLEAPAGLATPNRLDPEQLAAALRAHPERGGPPKAPPEVVERQMSLVMRVFAHHDADAYRAALAALDLPVMVLFGTRDGLIAPETGREFKRLIARADLVYVYDAAHQIAGDRPEAFADLVGDFLERHEAHIVERTSRVRHP